jgi:hypothetical protein
MVHTQVLQPVRLPAVRARLAQHWLTDDVSRRVLLNMPKGTQVFLPGLDVGQPDAFAVQIRGADLNEQMVDSFRRRVGGAVEDAELYWLSEQFSELAAEAAEDLPDMTIEEHELPSSSGLLVYDALPMRNLAFGAHGITIHAVTWFTLPRRGVWVTVYVVPELSRELVGPNVSRDFVRKEIGFLMPHAPGGGAPFGATTAQGNIPPLMRVLFATWFLIKQPGVAAIEEGPVDRSAKRRAERNGRTYPSVNVVNLRRRPVPEGREAPVKGRSYGVQWIVKGHWRDQAYGAGRSLRRRIYIAPYLKGPQDAPVKAPAPTVKKLA